MSNAVGKTARREEEIAFLSIEQILGVDIKLADAGAGDKMPDGFWLSPDDQARRAFVEVTSPPATSLMREWATAKREGRSQNESGSVPTRWGELAQICAEMFAENWAVENFSKLLAQPADERHLFLFGRGHNVEHYFYRLSGSYNDSKVEPIDDLVVPDGITDVWFRGRARRDWNQPLGTTEIWLARFQTSSGWHRYVVSIEERQLPSPNPSIVDDSVPKNWRQPKNRTMPRAGH